MENEWGGCQSPNTQWKSSNTFKCENSMMEKWAQKIAWHAFSSSLKTFFYEVKIFCCKKNSLGWENCAPLNKMKNLLCTHNKKIINVHQSEKFSLNHAFRLWETLSICDQRVFLIILGSCIKVKRLLNGEIKYSGGDLLEFKFLA